MPRPKRRQFTDKQWIEFLNIDLDAARECVPPTFTLSPFRESGWKGVLVARMGHVTDDGTKFGVDFAVCTDEFEKLSNRDTAWVVRERVKEAKLELAEGLIQHRAEQQRLYEHELAVFYAKEEQGDATEGSRKAV